MTLDLDSFISIFALAIGTGSLIKLMQFVALHGRYTLKVDTLWNVYLEGSKAKGTDFGAVTHGSQYRIDLDWLGAKIKETGYIPDPEILAYFRAIALDPKCPADDANLFILLENKFGMWRLVQEAARFECPADAVAGVWVLCVRAAQQFGVDEVLRRINVNVVPGGSNGSV